MKAAIFQGPGKIEVAERPHPVIIEPTDAVVRVVLACVCGSDLWYYRGETDFGAGDPIGHEFIGVVEQVGDDVAGVKAGDFVVSPFAYSDGTCPDCQVGMTTACAHGGFLPATDGCQGEFVRVPLADGTLVVVPGTPEDYSDEVLASLLALSDVMGTGHHAAVSAEVKPGDTVAVVGDGAVGLCAVLAAKRLGAQRIIALSRHADRQLLAKEFGATDIVDIRGEEAVKQVTKLTDGVGVDAALECVGTDEAMQTALAISRAGAIVGNVGLPHGVELQAQAMFHRNVGVHGGPAPVRAYLPELIDDVLAGRINPGKVFDFQTDLDGIAEAYERMDQRRAIKSLIKV
jgi:alcohol dehydrogenase